MQLNMLYELIDQNIIELGLVFQLQVAAPRKRLSTACPVLSYL